MLNGFLILLCSIVCRYERADVERGGKFEVESMATTTIFYVSCFQYLMLAFALSKGPPYRKRIWTNGTSSLQPVLQFTVSVQFVFELMTNIIASYA